MVTCPTRADGTPRRAMGRRLAMSALLAALCAAAGALLVAPAAFAKTYSDVPKGYWDRADIAWVTNQGPAAARALDDYGARFKPGQAVTREQFARALVVIGGLQGVQNAPIAVADVPATDPYYSLRADRPAPQAALAVQEGLPSDRAHALVAGRRRASCACCASSTPRPTGTC